MIKIPICCPLFISIRSSGLYFFLSGFGYKVEDFKLKERNFCLVKWLKVLFLFESVVSGDCLVKFPFLPSFYCFNMIFLGVMIFLNFFLLYFFIFCFCSLLFGVFLESKRVSQKWLISDGLVIIFFLKELSIN